jgi:hypothetical protein
VQNVFQRNHSVRDAATFKSRNLIRCENQQIKNAAPPKPLLAHNCERSRLTIPPDVKSRPSRTQALKKLKRLQKQLASLRMRRLKLMKLQALSSANNATIARLKREEEEADAWRRAQTPSATPAPSSYTLTDAFKSSQRPAHHNYSALTTATDSQQEQGESFLQHIRRIRKQNGFAQDADDDATKAIWLI